MYLDEILSYNVNIIEKEEYELNERKLLGLHSRLSTKGTIAG